jgi:hypothetical protein
MALKPTTRRAIEQALVSPSSARDLIDSIGSGGFAGTAPAASTPVAVTYTAAADSYSAGGALTIANGGTPTVVELLHYIKELQRQITAIQTKLTARGVTL